jgi:methyl-accepting chemotaxis protein
MEFKRYRDWSIFTKVMSISLVSALLLILATSILVPFIRSLVMNEKQHALAMNIQQATSLLGSYQKQVETGGLTQEEAKRQAAERLAGIRYDGSNYLWIHDLENKMVMHPIKPELNGKDMSQEKDAKGANFFIEMTQTCKDKGKGYVLYQWPKPGDTKPTPKLSCVELFQPWGWIVGTGIYIDDVDVQMHKIEIGIGVALCIMLALTILLTLLISRTITVPVSTLANQTRQVADGNLNVDFTSCSGDEIGQLSGSFKTMTENLRIIISQVSDTSSQVAAAANQLNSTASRIANDAEEVVAQATTVATAGEEMSATSGDIAQNCQMAAEAAQSASQSAYKGAEVVEKSVKVMSQIAERVQESARTVESLGARSDQIGAIIGTIEDIADQTNLLALNAAIEAARAGEQGRGFAVVADEVRALAERTTKATKEIGEMIKAIQNETKGAVAAMEQGVQQVENGTIEATRSGEALNDILEQVNAVTMQVNQIATAAEEQTATTNEISHNMHQINTVVGDTAGCAHEAATAASQLNGNAAELQRLVRQFKL